MKNLLFVFCFIIFIPKIKAQDRDITSASDILQLALPAIALGSTFIWNDDNTKPTWQFIKAYGSCTIIQQALKRIVLKPRPDGSNNYSFPSGHTTCAFLGAGFIQKRYGWEYGVPAYILASFVGYSRIQAKKHDGWDVLAGATIGIGSAYLFTKAYQYTNIEVSIQETATGTLVGMNYTF